MNTTPHKLQLAAVIFAIASIATAMFPEIPPSADRKIMKSGVSEENSSTMPDFASSEAYGLATMGFETNRGQTEEDVKFIGRGDGFALLLKPSQAIISIPRRKSAPASATQRGCDSLSADTLSMKLEGANRRPVISGMEPQSVRANYFIGDDPAKWIRDVETYSRVLYSDVYPGVDLVFYGNQRQLEYDFTLRPGADPRGIRLRFEGAENLELNSKGSLILHTPGGEVTHNPPVAYQENNGGRLEVPAEFERLDDGTIGFQVGAYDRSLPLVIDPVLVYVTYLGGSDNDACRGVVADSDGNAYLVGDSFSSDFLHRASAINSDVFVGKLSHDGLLLTYTFFGGSKNDFATGLRLDASGSIYLCGSTESSDFPRLSSFGSALAGVSDAFVIKLTPSEDKSSLLFEYSTLIGGKGEETAVSIATDDAGSAYIAGRTSSEDFPTLGAIQSAYGGGDSDAFVSKLVPSGNLLVYSTLLGGSGSEDVLGSSGIAVDELGIAYVTGDTQSTDFPTLHALRSSKNGSESSSDGFVAKINASGSDFVYSTYIGGSEDDFALGVAADSSGSAFVTGRTKSTSFTGSGSTRPLSTNTDAFVAKLNPDGLTLSYLTFIGGSAGDESANAIAINSSGDTVIAGVADDGAPTVKSIQSFSRGGKDAFIAELGPGGAVTFSTYLGGSDQESALGVALDKDGIIYVTGTTDSTDLPTVSPLIRDNAGKRDIFIAKIDPTISFNRPVLVQAVISGKHLILYGQGFDSGATLRVNDQPVKTRNDDRDPTQVLFAKKAAKRIGAGRTVQLQVENANGKRSNFLFLTKPE